MAKKPKAAGAQAAPADVPAAPAPAAKTPANALEALVAEKARAGRPSYAPSAEGRQLVTDLAFAGIPQDRIAKHHGISQDTLRKHFSVELDPAVDAMLAECVKYGLSNKARAGDTTSAIFIAKTRLRWREQPTQNTSASNSTPPSTPCWRNASLEHTGKDGAPIAMGGKGETCR